METITMININATDDLLFAEINETESIFGGGGSGGTFGQCGTLV